MSDREALEIQFEATGLTGAAYRDGDVVWVSLQGFAAGTGTLVKQIDGRHAMCDEEGGDVCVLLPDDGVRDVDGDVFGRLGAFADALGFDWSVTDDGVLILRRGASTSPRGLSVGQRPPLIELPDVTSGRLVSSDVYYGRPAVFYMWASW